MGVINFLDVGSEIKKLKRAALRVVTQMDEAVDGVDCGRSLLREVSPEFREAEQCYTEIMRRLRQIDPMFPYRDKLAPYELPREK